VSSDAGIHSVEGGVTAPLGFEAAGAEGGIRYHNRPDVGILRCDELASAAAVFTTNRVFAAPVGVSRAHLDQTGGRARAIVVNAGNANACTGEEGRAAARDMASHTAAILGVAQEEVLVASTGVIGEPLPMDAVRRGIDGAARALRRDGAGEFARAIMTTDSHPKENAVELSLGGQAVRVGGCCKGAGMIAPHMATMLAFVATDARVSPGLLSILLRRVVARTFNRITVDGDRSTNDSVFLLASGATETVEAHTQSERLFEEALEAVCGNLARQIARDGEGATRLMEVRVRGAKTEGDALAAARAVATSSLVRTAVYGRDPNWGRVLCALGYSGADFAQDRVELWIEDVQLVRNGVRTAYDEQAARHAFECDPFHITADLHAGDAEATYWTCDLTEEYVRSNAAYRS
jgi:glutamate N-acetyltransferase/amino-acid N-acetyltransferase